MKNENSKIPPFLTKGTNPERDLVILNNMLSEYKSDVRLLKVMLMYLEGNDDAACNIVVHLPGNNSLEYSIENNVNLVGAIKAELIDVDDLIQREEKAKQITIDELNRKASMAKEPSALVDDSVTRIREYAQAPVGLQAGKKTEGNPYFNGENILVPGLIIDNSDCLPPRSDYHIVRIRMGQTNLPRFTLAFFPNQAVAHVSRRIDLGNELYDFHLKPLNEEEAKKILLNKPGETVIFFPCELPKE